MPAIGLRSRFFALILIVVLLVLGSSIFLYSILLRRERLASIDQQVRETAAALVDSELGDLRKIDFDEADNIISEELGVSRIGKFFVIRNSKGDVIFESSSAGLLPTQAPQSGTWFELSRNGKFIRGLNLKLARIPDRTLQVGLMLDESIVYPNYFSRTSLIFAVFVFLFSMAVSFFLASLLMKPIAKLGTFLTDVAEASRKQALLPTVPEEILADPKMDARDEFERVVAGLNALIHKINKNYQFSRLWAYQMAHELKTPLSIARMEIEKIQKKHSWPASEFASFESENRKISDTINAFLGWAELENSSQQKYLYMNRLGEITAQIVHRLDEAGNRIQLEIGEESSVLSNPHHLEQLILNLIQNSLVHSPPETPVKVRVSNLELIVEDQGGGIPKEVLERLGEPFNRRHTQQKTERGHGLGLAWIMSICRLYNWEIKFSNEGVGTKARVYFQP